MLQYVFEYARNAHLIYSTYGQFYTDFRFIYPTFFFELKQLTIFKKHVVNAN